MNTPPRNRRVDMASSIGGALSVEDKERLIENLDIEVTAHRRRCEEFIEQLLESFSVRHGIEITRIPRSIRQMKLKEFDAHGGNIQACVQAMAKQRIADNDSENHAKKRKWQEIYVAGQEDERAAKTPRIAPLSPVKATPKANKARALFPKTPTRTLNLPHKPQPPNTNSKLSHQTKELLPSTKSRPASPVKQTSQFKPASTTFNPVLPHKTPNYPRRQARQNEHVMSINGTPLALPMAPPFASAGAGAGLDEIEEDDTDTDLKKAPRTGSGGFIVRRDPYSMGSTTTAVSSSSTGPLITVSTHRGHTIQFDPLTASPGSLDRLPNLTDSAKKQVKDDTARIIQALGKWRL